MKSVASELDETDIVIRFSLFYKKDNFGNHLLDCSNSKPSYW